MVYVYTVARERETYYLSDKHVTKRKSFPYHWLRSTQSSFYLPSLLIFDNDSASAASLAMILVAVHVGTMPHEDNRQHTDKIRVSSSIPNLELQKPFKNGGSTQMYPVPDTISP